jgi:putative membrane protein
MWHGYDGWAWWGFGAFHMVGFWIVVICVLVFVLRGWRGGAGMPHCFPSAGHESALDVLQKRYARGEITQKEYEEMKGVLGK